MADYCTSAQVKATGRLNITGDDYDTEIGELISAASRWIDRWCALGLENAFAATASATRYYDSEAVQGDTLHLDFPLLSASAISDGAGGALATDDYRLLPRNGPFYDRVRLRPAGRAWAMASDAEASVTGVWGLAASCPKPVSEACAMLAAWMFKRWQMALADATANQELGRVIYGEAMPKQVAELLRPFRWGVLA